MKSGNFRHSPEESGTGPPDNIRTVYLKYSQDVFERKEEEKKDTKNTDFITTPQFRKAKVPQQRNILKDTVIDREKIRLHQQMEVLEKRMRQYPEVYLAPTEEVAEIYASRPELEMSPEEALLQVNYDNESTPIEVPNFWDPRSYDKPEEYLDNERSERLEQKIDGLLNVVLKDKPERMNRRERRRLLELLEHENEKGTEKNEREKQTRHVDYEDWFGEEQELIKQTAPQRKKKLVGIDWSYGINLTESSSDDTEPNDFILLN